MVNRSSPHDPPGLTVAWKAFYKFMIVSYLSGIPQKKDRGAYPCQLVLADLPRSLYHPGM
jgi:hypothetical protein